MVQGTLGIENAVYLSAAGFQHDGHPRLRNLFLLHGLGELPGHDFLDSLRLRFFKDAFLLQEIIDARAHIPLAHFSSSFWRLRANAKSSSGVTRVFLMNPCSATMWPW